MTLHVFVIIGYITAALGFLGAAGGALHWLYCAAKKVDETFTFVGQVRSNHLPHIHVCLKLIATKLGIELPEEDKD
jgi:hypothetical protein